MLTVNQLPTSQSREEKLENNDLNNKETTWMRLTTFFDNNQRILMLIIKIILLIVVIIGLVLFWKYRYVISLWMVIKILHWPFTKLYSLLLRQMTLILKREESISLSQYAKKVTTNIPKIRNKFSQLTKQYETIVYGQEKDTRLDSFEMKEVLRISKQLVKEKRTPS